MPYLLVEQYRPRAAWWALTRDEREEYIGTIVAAVAHVQSLGVRALGGGVQPSALQAGSGYPYFAAYVVPDEGTFEALQQAIAASGWYHYFEQVNGGGALEDVAAVLRSHVDAP